jgi:hypothetical protein
MTPYAVFTPLRHYALLLYNNLGKECILFLPFVEIEKEAAAPP